MSNFEQHRLALIVGSMKSGTTSLFALLSQHSEIAPCSEKEPGFFSHDERWARGLDHYRSLWPDDLPAGTVLLEASTHYSKSHLHPDAPERISASKQAFEDLRVIYIMREPIARMVSQYRHLVSHGFIEASSDGQLPMLERILSVSRYAEQIGPYIDRLGAERVLLLSFEQLRDAPADTLARVCRFLGVDDTYAFERLGESHNPSGAGGPVLSSARAIPGAMVLASWLPGGLKRRLFGALRRTPRKIPCVVTQERRDEMLRLLAPDLQRLRDEYGFDTGIWSRAGNHGSA
jgi:hypothetical protein